MINDTLDPAAIRAAWQCAMSDGARGDASRGAPLEMLHDDRRAPSTFPPRVDLLSPLLVPDGQTPTLPVAWAERERLSIDAWMPS